MTNSNHRHQENRQLLSLYVVILWHKHKTVEPMNIHSAYSCHTDLHKMLIDQIVLCYAYAL